MSVGHVTRFYKTNPNNYCIVKQFSVVFKVVTSIYVKSLDQLLTTNALQVDDVTSVLDRLVVIEGLKEQVLEVSQ